MIEYKDRFCLIPESSINIMPDGSITPCCGLTTKHDVVGNIFLSTVYKKYLMVLGIKNLDEYIVVGHCLIIAESFV
jgi:hypothetical protein